MNHIVEDTTILQRSMYIQFEPIDLKPSVTFAIEETIERDGHKFIHSPFGVVYSEDELDARLHPAIYALCNDEVIGKTALMYVNSLFHDIILLNIKQHGWISRYFPKWHEELIEQTDNSGMEKLLKIQRSIEDGSFVEDQTVRGLYRST